MQYSFVAPVSSFYVFCFLVVLGGMLEKRSIRRETILKFKKAMGGSEARTLIETELSAGLGQNRIPERKKFPETKEVGS